MSIVNTSSRLYGQPVLLYAESLKRELDSLRPLNADAERRIMQKFQLDWNYHSNHLEGTQLTYGETKALILFGITAQGKPLKDHLEITGHNEAIELVIEVVNNEYPLTESFIRQLHTLLLKKPYYVDAVSSNGQSTKRLVKIGKYKSYPNHVLTTTGEIFYFASPEETPSKMMDLIDWYRQKKDENNLNPIILSAEFHYKFIRIHPFDDGNGRLARILMNFVLMQFGYPPVIIKTEDKNNYFSVLQQADAGIFEPFVEYVAQNLISSLEIMIKGAKGENIEEPEDLDKEIALLEQKVRNTGRKIEVRRNPEVIRSLIANSLLSLANSFIEIGRKFDSFYLNKRFQIIIDGRAVLGEYDNAIYYVKEELANTPLRELSDMRMVYFYEDFNQEILGSFNYSSEIDVRFGSTHYEIFNNGDKYNVLELPANHYKKLYNEQLNQQEINALTRFEADMHKNLIEKRLSDYENPDVDH